MSRHFAFAVSVLCAGAAPAPLAAQWTIGLEAAVSRFTGASFDTTTGGTGSSLRPHRPTIFGVRAERELGRAGIGLGVLYAAAGLVAENREVAVVQNDVFEVVELAPEVWMRLGRTRAGAELRLHVGPVLDLWSQQHRSGASRSRAGAHAALSADWPVIPRVAGSIRAAAAVTPSIFTETELPPEFERRATWRGSVAIGLRYTL